MSADIAAKRHMCHHPSISAEKQVTEGVTGDGSKCHPSPYVSPEKPRNHAEGDTYDTSEHYSGVTPEKDTSMTRRKPFTVQARLREWENADGTVDTVVRMFTGKRGGINVDLAELPKLIADLARLQVEALQEEESE